MTPPEHQADDDDDFTFPTPQLLHAGARDLCSLSSPPPVWMHLSSPIRRSFSAADCAASPWRGRVSLINRYCDGCEEEQEEEERMDSLWEDLNDEDDLSLDVSRRRSVGSKERAMLGGASRSSRRRRGLVEMMRALKKMLIVRKGKSRVHRDERQSTSTASGSAAYSPSLPPACNNNNNNWKK